MNRTRNFTTVSIPRTLKTRLDNYCGQKAIPSTLEQMLLKSQLADIFGVDKLIYWCAHAAKEGGSNFRNEDERLLASICLLVQKQQNGELKFE